MYLMLDVSPALHQPLAFQMYTSGNRMSSAQMLWTSNMLCSIIQSDCMLPALCKSMLTWILSAQLKSSELSEKVPLVSPDLFVDDHKHVL